MIGHSPYANLLGCLSVQMISDLYPFLIRLVAGKIYTKLHFAFPTIGTSWSTISGSWIMSGKLLGSPRTHDDLNPSRWIMGSCWHPQSRRKSPNITMTFTASARYRDIFRLLERQSMRRRALKRNDSPTVSSNLSSVQKVKKYNRKRPQTAGVSLGSNASGCF